MACWAVGGGPRVEPNIGTPRKSVANSVGASCVPDEGTTQVKIRLGSASVLFCYIRVWEDRCEEGEG
jgi:hypothetical protein